MSEEQLKESASLSWRTPVHQKANKYRVFIATEGRTTKAQPLHKCPTARALQHVMLLPIHKPKNEVNKKISMLAFAGYAHKLPEILKSQGVRNVAYLNLKRGPASASGSPNPPKEQTRKRCRNFITTTRHRTLHGHFTHRSTAGKEEAERALLLSVQKELNQDFAAERIEALQAANVMRAPQEFLLAIVLNRMSSVEQYMNSYCATALDRKHLVNTPDQYGRSPIFYAAYLG